MLYLSVLFESRDSITLIFLSRYNRDGCQFNMSTNVCFFLSSLVSQSGCKTKTSFCFLQEKFKVFFWEFFHPNFFIFLTSLSRNFPCFAGCKCKKHFQISQAFLNLFFQLLSKFWFVCLSVFQWTSFVVAGAKVPPLFTFTSFYFAFFPCFFNLFLNLLVTAYLQFRFFWFSVSFFLVRLWFWQFTPLFLCCFCGVFRF